MTRPGFPVLAATALTVLALAGCGDGAKARDGERATKTASAASSTPPVAADTAPARTAPELFARIDAALARHTSVRQDMGNLNPPPAAVLRHEYGGGEDDFVFEFLLEMDDRSESLGFARSDGAYYGRDFGSDVWQEAPSEPSADDDSPVARAAHSDVRQDFQRYGAMTTGLRFVGEETVAGHRVQHYAGTVRLAELQNPSTLPALQTGSKPIDLWVAPTGLPVRVDVRYSEPIGGTPGTRVSRTDYSAWSEPVDPEVD